MDKRTEDSIVIEGKNVEEALQAACDRLGTTPNQVEYEVVEGGAKGGVLSFLKGKTVKIRVQEKSAAQRMIAEIVKELFEKMGVQVEHQVTRGEDAYEIDLETDDADGLLIGRGGDTLKALQHLISRMVGHRDEAVRVRVDVAGYRKRRQDALRRKARELADRALSQGRDALTEPLPADERRIVHLELAEHGSVETRAVGDGQTKRVAVSPLASARRGRRSTEEKASSGRRSRRGPGRARVGSGDRARGGGRNRRAAADARRSDREPRRGDREPRRSDSEPQRSDAEAAATAREADDGGEIRRHRVGQRDRKRRRPREETTPRFSEDERERRDSVPESGGSEQEEKESRNGAPAANGDSYFNIPDSVVTAADNGNGDEGEKPPLTWGRKRRPARGRR